jgi:hypothetical protein
MRYLVPLTALLLAGCASTPTPSPEPAAPASPAAGGAHSHSTLAGMTANELAQHFGKPKLQIREGDGTKLQFAGPACVLDAYLYPSQGGGGVPRVTHVDARNAQGDPVNVGGCIASLEAP